MLMMRVSPFMGMFFVELPPAPLFPFQQKLVQLFERHVYKLLSDVRISNLLLGSATNRLLHLTHALVTLRANVGEIVVVQVQQIDGQVVVVCQNGGVIICRLTVCG